MHKNKRLHKTVSLIVSMLFLINNISWQAPYITRTAHKKDTLKEMAAALDGRTSESIGSMLMSGSIKVVPPGSIASKADSEGDLTDDELRIAVLCGQWEVVDMIWKAESGHPKGSLNLLPLSMSAYFGGTFRYDANDPDWVNRDRLVVSGGHTAPGLYVPQAEAGFRDRKQAVPMKELLPTLRQKGSPLQGHIDMTYTPADMSAGSLGKGPSAAAGMAHAGKMDDRDYFVEVEIGDSESTEGQISEAMDYIGFNRLDNVIIWENRNEKGLTGDLSRLTRADNLKRAEAFGFRTHLVRNGDDPAAVEAMRRQIRKEVEVARKELKRLQYLLEHKCIGPAQEANLSLWVEAAKEKIKPTYVQYITTPGAGLPGMQAHGEAPKTDQRDAAVTEIKRQLKELTGVDFDEAKRDAVMREFKQRVMITAEQKNRIDNENEKRVAARRAEMQAIADGVKYVSPVNPASNYATRSAGGDELVGIMKDDLGVVAIDLELEPSVKLSKAAKAFYFNHTIDKPTGRVIEAACREVNAANLAAGFATCGKIPVVHTFASFIPMMAEPLLTILNTSLPIILVGTHAGLATGPDGRTHQDPNSQRIIGALPGTELFESCDAEEARLIGRFIHKWAREVAQTGHTKGKAHIFYERRARLDTPIIRKPEGWEKEAERGFYVIYENDLAEKERISHPPGLKVINVVIVSVGTPTYDAVEAAKELAKEGVSVRVINVTQHKSLIRNEENIRGFAVLIKDADNLITVCDALPETIGEYVNTVTIKTAIQHKSIRNLGIQLWGESATPAELYYEHGFDKTGIVRTALDAVKSSSAGKAKVTQADHSAGMRTGIERKRGGLSAGFFAWDRYSKGEQVIRELKVGEPLKNLNFAEGIEGIIIEELTPARAEIRLRRLTSRLRIAGALAEEGYKHLSGAELFSKAITLEKRAEQTNPLMVLKSLPQTPDAWAKYFENPDAYGYFKKAWSKQIMNWVCDMLLPWTRKRSISIGGERVKLARTETLQRVYQYKEAIFELPGDSSVIVGWNEAKPNELILKVISPSKDFNIDKEGADLRSQRLFNSMYEGILGMNLEDLTKSSSAGENKAIEQIKKRISNVLGTISHMHYFSEMQRTFDSKDRRTLNSYKVITDYLKEKIHFLRTEIGKYTHGENETLREAISRLEGISKITNQVVVGNLSVVDGVITIPPSSIKDYPGETVTMQVTRYGRTTKVTGVVESNSTPWYVHLDKGSYSVEEEIDACWLGSEAPTGKSSSAGTTFSADLQFLKRHLGSDGVVVLSDASGNAQLAVCHAYQGRVMTSAANGLKGLSFGWINREQIKKMASGQRDLQINVVGGADRLWIGPEGGQYGIFFEKDSSSKFWFEKWKTPAFIDTEPFEVFSGSIKRNSVTFWRNVYGLTNRLGTKFDLRIDRTIRVLERKEVAKKLGVGSLPKSVSVVSYESDNRLTNIGEEPWRKKTGLLSMWNLGQFIPSPNTTVVVPIKPGPEERLGRKITDGYFGKPSVDRLVTKKNKTHFFKADGQKRGKIGVPPERARSIIGSYDAENDVLTLVQYNKPKGATEYVNSLWEIQEKPFDGDAVNAYCDGPVKPGEKPLGPFYELETSSPALALKPGETSAPHIHRTIHLKGPEAVLNKIALKTLGVSLDEIKTAFDFAIASKQLCAQFEKERELFKTLTDVGMGRLATYMSVQKIWEQALNKLSEMASELILKEEFKQLPVIENIKDVKDGDIVISSILIKFEGNSPYILMGPLDPRWETCLEGCKFRCIGNIAELSEKQPKSSSAGYEYEEVAAGQIARFSERLMPDLEKSAREHIIVENIILSLDIPKLINDIKKSTERHILRTLFIKSELKTLPLLKDMIDKYGSGQIVSIRTESDSPALELMNLIGKIADQQEVDKPLMAVIFFDCVKAKEFIDRLCILEELRQKQPYEIAVKVAAYPILDPIRSNYTRELLSKFEGPKASDLKSSSAGITVEVNKVPAIFGYLDIEERDSIRSIISGLTGKDGLRSSDPWIKTWAAINLSLFDKNIIYKCRKDIMPTLTSKGGLLNRNSWKKLWSAIGLSLLDKKTKSEYRKDIIPILTGKNGLRSRDPWKRLWAAIGLFLFDKETRTEYREEIESALPGEIGLKSSSPWKRMRAAVSLSLLDKKTASRYKEDIIYNLAGKDGLKSGDPWKRLWAAIGLLSIDKGKRIFKVNIHYTGLKRPHTILAKDANELAAKLQKEVFTGLGISCQALSDKRIELSTRYAYGKTVTEAIDIYPEEKLEKTLLKVLAPKVFTASPEFSTAVKFPPDVKSYKDILQDLIDLEARRKDKLVNTLRIMKKPVSLNRISKSTNKDGYGDGLRLVHGLSQGARDNFNAVMEQNHGIGYWTAYLAGVRVRQTLEKIANQLRAEQIKAEKSQARFKYSDAGFIVDARIHHREFLQLQFSEGVVKQLLALFKEISGAKRRSPSVFIEAMEKYNYPNIVSAIHINPDETMRNWRWEYLILVDDYGVDKIIYATVKPGKKPPYVINYHNIRITALDKFVKFVLPFIEELSKENPEAAECWNETLKRIGPQDTAGLAKSSSAGKTVEIPVSGKANNIRCFSEQVLNERLSASPGLERELQKVLELCERRLKPSKNELAVFLGAEKLDPSSLRVYAQVKRHPDDLPGKVTIAHTIRNKEGYLLFALFSEQEASAVEIPYSPQERKPDQARDGLIKERKMALIKTIDGKEVSPPRTVELTVGDKILVISIEPADYRNRMGEGSATLRDMQRVRTKLAFVGGTNESTIRQEIMALGLEALHYDSLEYLGTYKGERVFVIESIYFDEMFFFSDKCVESLSNESTEMIRLSADGHMGVVRQIKPAKSSSAGVSDVVEVGMANYAPPIPVITTPPAYAELIKMGLGDKLRILVGIFNKELKHVTALDDIKHWIPLKELKKDTIEQIYFIGYKIAMDSIPPSRVYGVRTKSGIELIVSPDSKIPQLAEVPEAIALCDAKAAIKAAAKSSSAGEVVKQELQRLCNEFGISEDKLVSKILSSLVPSQFITDVAEAGGRPTKKVVEELKNITWAPTMLESLIHRYEEKTNSLIPVAAPLPPGFKLGELMELISDITKLQKTSPERMIDIFFNCIEPTTFIENFVALANLSDSKESRRDLAIRLTRDYPTLALVGTAYRVMHLEDEPKGKTITLKAEDIVNPAALSGYGPGLLNIKVTLPETLWQVDENKYKAVMDHFSQVAKAAANRKYNYRGEVLEYYQRFMQTEVRAYRRFIKKNFGNRDNIKYLITSGIGANEMYSYLMAALHNSFEKGTRWIVIDEPADISSLPEDATASNSLYFEVSRSGETQETEKLLQFLHNRFPKRIVYANKGPLRISALALGKKPGHSILVKFMPQDIGGRLMRRKSPILLGPMYLAGMDTRAYAEATERFDKQLSFTNGPGSLAVGLARFLYVCAVLGNRHQMVIMYNQKRFLLASAEEINQLLMEGANKKQEYKLTVSLHALARDAHRSIEGIYGQAASYVGLGIIARRSGFESDDKTKLTEADLAGLEKDPTQQHLGLSINEVGYTFAVPHVRKCQRIMPTISIEVDSVTTEVAAALSSLWEDLTVHYCALTGQDPNSNAEVKAVREDTADLLTQMAQTKRASKPSSAGTFTVDIEDVRYVISGEASDYLTIPAATQADLKKMLVFLERDEVSKASYREISGPLFKNLDECPSLSQIFVEPFGLMLGEQRVYGFKDVGPAKERRIYIVFPNQPRPELEKVKLAAEWSAGKIGILVSKEGVTKLIMLGNRPSISIETTDEGYDRLIKMGLGDGLRKLVQLLIREFKNVSELDEFQQQAAIDKSGLEIERLDFLGFKLSLPVGSPSSRVYALRLKPDLDLVILPESHIPHLMDAPNALILCDAKIGIVAKAKSSSAGEVEIPVSGKANNIRCFSEQVLNERLSASPGLERELQKVLELCERRFKPSKDELAVFLGPERLDPSSLRVYAQVKRHPDDLPGKVTIAHTIRDKEGDLLFALFTEQEASAVEIPYSPQERRPDQARDGLIKERKMALIESIDGKEVSPPRTVELTVGNKILVISIEPADYRNRMSEGSATLREMQEVRSILASLGSIMDIYSIRSELKTLGLLALNCDSLEYLGKYEDERVFVIESIYFDEMFFFSDKCVESLSNESTEMIRLSADGHMGVVRQIKPAKSSSAGQVEFIMNTVAERLAGFFFLPADRLNVEAIGDLKVALKEQKSRLTGLGKLSCPVEDAVRAGLAITLGNYLQAIDECERLALVNDGFNKILKEISPEKTDLKLHHYQPAETDVIGTIIINEDELQEEQKNEMVRLFSKISKYRAEAIEKLGANVVLKNEYNRDEDWAPHMVAISKNPIPAAKEARLLAITIEHTPDALLPVDKGLLFAKGLLLYLVTDRTPEVEVKLSELYRLLRKRQGEPLQETGLLEKFIDERVFTLLLPKPERVDKEQYQKLLRLRLLTLIAA